MGEFHEGGRPERPLASDAPLPNGQTEPAAAAAPRRSSGPRLNILLFLATLFTTTLVGAVWWQHPELQAYPWKEFLSRLFLEGLFLDGFVFSIPLLAVLVTHEFGHYYFGRRHGVDVSLPYFIPIPTIIGTMGAAILIRSPIPNRRVLLDIGAAGPLAGIAVAVPVFMYGMSISNVGPVPPPGAIPPGMLFLGTSVGVEWLAELVLGVHPGTAPISIDLHPVAVAGWFGLLITAFNLIPVGQLDGGHVATALLGRHARWAWFISFAFLLYLAIFKWHPWFLWIMLMTLLASRPVRIVEPSMRPDRKRVLIGLITMLVLFGTFVPVPFGVAG